MSPTVSQEPATSTISHAMTRTTTVRTAVARFESTSRMPTFANMDVRAANTADSRANSSQVSMGDLPSGDPPAGISLDPKYGLCGRSVPPHSLTTAKIRTG